MAEPLTPIERKVYHYLLDFLAENTYQPSIREIGKRFRIKSTKTVSDILQSLAEKGYIAGDPSRLPTNVRAWITLDRRFVPSDDAFFLRVDGDSMIGRGIYDRDYVLV